MKISFDEFQLHADYHNSIYMQNDHHEDVQLGYINDDGNYDPPSWLISDDDFEGLLKEALREQYFGEKTVNNQVFHQQDEWPQNYVDFMKLEELKDIAKGYEKISLDPDSNADKTGRYRSEDGKGLHGLYTRKNDGITEDVLIHNGIKSIELIYPDVKHDFESEQCSYDNLKISYDWEWYDESGKRVNINKEAYEAVIDGRIPMASVYYKDQVFLEEQLKKAQDNNCIYKIYYHKEDKRKAKMVIAQDKAITDLFDLEKLKRAFKSLFTAVDKQKDILGVESSVSENDIDAVIDSLKEKHLSDFLGHQLSARFESMVIHNLLSGFPIELTVSQYIKSQKV